MEICGFRLLKTRSDGSFLVYDGKEKQCLDIGLSMLKAGMHSEPCFLSWFETTSLMRRAVRTWEAHPAALSTDGSCIIS